MSDMSIEELMKYQGRNPKPADYESFWDESIEEMKAIDPKVTFTDADFYAPGITTKHMFFTGAHGARIHANYACPEKTDGKHPAIVWFHGYAGSAANFLSLLPYAYAGFVIASMDVRGQGGLSEDTSSTKGPTMYGHIINGIHDPDPKRLFFRDVYLDAAQLAMILMGMDYVDEQKVGAMGDSQGGALTIACAALEPRIAQAAPQFPFLCDYKRVFEMELHTGAYVGIRDYFRHFDPMHKTEDTFFEKLGYIDVQFLAPRIRAKVLMGTGLLDTRCPPSTQFAAYNKMKCEKNVVFFPDYTHEEIKEFLVLTHQFMMKLL